MRVTLGAILVWVAACAPDFDATRTSDSNSLGQRMVTLLCKRLAFQAEPTDVRGDHFRDACAGGDIPADAPPTLAALLTSRPALVKAIDTAAPDAFTGELQAFLTSDATLALYDDDTMSRSIASLADLLDEVSHDGAALTALARVATRDGYRPAAVAFGFPAALALARSSAPGASGMPSLHAVLTSTVPAITAGGAAHDEWNALVAALSATLLDVSPASDAGSPERTLALASDLLLTERPDLLAIPGASRRSRPSRARSRRRSSTPMGTSSPTSTRSAGSSTPRARRSIRPRRRHSRSPMTRRRATRRAG